MSSSVVVHDKTMGPNRSPETGTYQTRDREMQHYKVTYPCGNKSNWKLAHHRETQVLNGSAHKNKTKVLKLLNNIEEWPYFSQGEAYSFLNKTENLTLKFKRIKDNR